MKDECIFCKIVSKEVKSKIICENDNFISFPDNNQKTKGHSLVVSKKHYKTTLDIPSTLGQELLDCIKETALKLMDENKCGGFNLVNNNFPSAGQFVHHVHFHILPRKKGESVGALY